MSLILLHVTASTAQDLWLFCHKLLHEAGHLFLGIISISRAICIFLMSLLRKDNHMMEKLHIKVTWVLLHLLETLLLLCETATHLVDTVFMICVGLSRALRGALSLLVLSLRSLQGILVSALEAEKREKKQGEDEEAEEEKQRVKPGPVYVWRNSLLKQYLSDTDCQKPFEH